MYELALQDVQNWPYDFEKALKILENMYGIDSESEHNKLLLLPYIDMQSDLKYDIETFSNNFEKDKIKDWGWEYIYNQDIEEWIDKYDISFTNEDGLDENDTKYLTHWLTYQYNENPEMFGKAYDVIIDEVEKSLRGAEKISDQSKKDLKELIDKVRSTEYSKAGHPKLDLQHIIYANKYL
jgi:hypothetical protein